MDSVVINGSLGQREVLSLQLPGIIIIIIIIVLVALILSGGAVAMFHRV